MDYDYGGAFLLKKSAPAFVGDLVVVKRVYEDAKTLRHLHCQEIMCCAQARWERPIEVMVSPSLYGEVIHVDN